MARYLWKNASVSRAGIFGRGKWFLSHRGGSPYDGLGGDGGRFIIRFLDDQDVFRSFRR